jgi:hypothetical protein
VAFSVHSTAVAQTSNTPLWFAGTAATVLDANNNVLGTVVGISSMSGPYDAITLFSKGYFVRVNLDGSFPIGSGYPLSWSGPNCTGSVYLNDGRYTQTGGAVTAANNVLFSAQTNSFYVPAGTGSTAASLPGISANYVENDIGCYATEFAPTGVISAWPLAPFDIAGTLGWKVGGSPLHLAGPLKFR